MTKEEARRVLEANHICQKHFIAMDEVSDNPFANFNAPKRYQCSKCRTEEWQRTAKEIEEAKAILQS